MTSLVDPVEQRDPWRAAWQILTHDALIIIACVVVISGLLTTLVLPQAPSAGTADPIAYSRWEAQAKLREGALYEPLSGLGLNTIFQAPWWRIALASLCVLAALRLMDRAGRLFGSRRARADVADEPRVRVMRDAPPTAEMAAWLRRRRFRVASDDEERVAADRWPWAEAITVVMHLGLLLAAGGVLLNGVVGWEANNRALTPGIPAALYNGRSLALTDDPAPLSAQTAFTAVLQPGNVTVPLVDEQPVTAAGITFRLRQVTPGYRVSAATLDGRALSIRASNFVSPTDEVLITFGEAEPERYLAVPDARLALAVSVGEPSLQAGRVRAFALPSGDVITDTTVRPEVVLNEARFVFTPARGAVVNASYQPGDVFTWVGLPLALIGFIGSLIFPAQRIIIRHHGHWTEFYATGRGVRKIVAELMEKKWTSNST